MKNIEITIWVPEHIFHILMALSRRCNVSVNEYVRSIILNYPYVKRCVEDNYDEKGRFKK